MTRRRRDERGAIAPMIAIMLLPIMLIITALVTDIGMQRVARSDAQSLADVVALDLAHELNGTNTVSVLTSRQTALANRSIASNPDVLGARQGRTPKVTVEWGRMVNGVFVKLTDGDAIPTAVQTKATTETGFVFTGVTGQGEGAAQRSAVASADKGACFRIGSFVARVKAGDSALLNPLLNAIGPTSALNVDLAGYQGIAAADVSLADLVSTGRLGVGSVSALLSAPNVNVADLVAASIVVLSQPGQGTSAVTLSALTAIEAALRLKGLQVKIGDLLDAAPSDPAALGSSVNVLDLITGAAIVANGTNAIALNNLTVGPIANITARTSLHVIQTPEKTCSTGEDGRVASNTQFKLVTRITSPAINLTPSIAGLASVGVRVDPIDLTLEVRLADAKAALLSLDECATGRAQKAVFQVSSSAVPIPTLSGQIKATLTASLLTGSGAVPSLIDTLLSGLTGILSPLAPIVSVNAKILKNATLTAVVEAPVALSGASGPGQYDKTVTVPLSYWQDPDNPLAYTVTGSLVPAIGTISVGPPNVTSITGSLTTNQALVVLLGVPISLGPDVIAPLTATANTALKNTLGPATIGPVTTLLNGLTSSLQATVIKQVSELLGLNIGGADLYVDHEPRCGAPRLVD